MMVDKTVATYGRLDCASGQSDDSANVLTPLVQCGDKLADAIKKHVFIPDRCNTVGTRFYRDMDAVVLVVPHGMVRLL